MSQDQGVVQGDYEAEVAAARSALMRDLDAADKVHDSAVMAAVSAFTARQQAARAVYFGERAESWRTFGAPQQHPWQQDTITQAIGPEGNHQ